MARTFPSRHERAADKGEEASGAVIRVGVISPEPTPYRAPLFDRIARLPEIDLTVIYAAPTVARREWQVQLDHDAVVLDGPRLPLRHILHHDYPLSRGLWSLLEKSRFDCVVIAGWSLFAAQLAVVWCRLRGVPYVLTSESHLLDSRPMPIRMLKRLVLPHVVAPAAGFLVTGSLAAEGIASYGADRQRIRVFANTVDVDALGEAVRAPGARTAARRELGFDDNEIVVAHVGRLAPEKGVETLLAAVAAARRATDAPLRLLLVGDGPLRERLHGQAERLALSLTAVGFRSGASLVGAYAAADVFALLSSSEPWGVVVNEAAAAGLPLVLSQQVGAAADLLRPNENGAVVAAGDVAGAAAAIAALASDSGMRARFGARSRELVEPWGYDASVAAFEETVQNAVAGSQP